MRGYTDNGFPPWDVVASQLYAGRQFSLKGQSGKHLVLKYYRDVKNAWRANSSYETLVKEVADMRGISPEENPEHFALLLFISGVVARITRIKIGIWARPTEEMFIPDDVECSDTKSRLLRSFERITRREFREPEPSWRYSGDQQGCSGLGKDLRQEMRLENAFPTLREVQEAVRVGSPEVRLIIRWAGVRSIYQIVREQFVSLGTMEDFDLIMVAHRPPGPRLEDFVELRYVTQKIANLQREISSAMEKVSSSAKGA
jgi:hypothetical protein